MEDQQDAQEYTKTKIGSGVAMFSGVARMGYVGAGSVVAGGAVVLGMAGYGLAKYLEGR